jgi:hypothetical protein
LPKSVLGLSRIAPGASSPTPRECSLQPGQDYLTRGALPIRASSCVSPFPLRCSASSSMWD